MKKRTKTFFIVLFTILFSSLFFTVLFRFNNKYTYPGSQASNGFLFLTEDNFEKYPLRFLWKGWEFYPDTLLSPTDFSSGLPSDYMYCISIGDQTQLGSLFDNSPHGCGSYAMHLVLPDTEHTYALELPEIFSAYRLYINDNLALEVGNPDPDNYRPITQNRMISFQASGSTDIIIAVSDYSHFYSGIVYPPAFGTPLALNLSRGVRFAISLTSSIVSCIAIVLSLYLGVMMKHKNTLLFTCLCLAACVFSSYGLLHSLLALPVFPWYAIELASGYLVTCLILVLHNRICNISFPVSMVSNGLAALFFAASLLYGLSSAHLNTTAIHIFSVCVFCYKAIVSLYLLGTAFYSAKFEKTSDNSPIFYSSVIYASAFVWDRIYADFEPIYGGWFAEWGSMVLILAIAYTLWRDMLRSYSYALTFSEQHKQVARQLAMQVAYSEQITSQMEEKRRITHDFRQQLRTIRNLALETGNQKGQQKLLDFLQETDAVITEEHRDSLPDFCQNAAVNAVLRYYYAASANAGIEAIFHFSLPETCPLSDVELCTVLGNLLENSLDACKRQPRPPYRIVLSSKETVGTFFILTKNTYDGKLKQIDGRLLSMKTQSVRFGVGLESIKEILNKYSGTIDLYPGGEIFKVGISIPLKNPEK